jgi:hypothetical protein
LYKIKAVLLCPIHQLFGHWLSFWADEDEKYLQFHQAQLEEKGFNIFTSNKVNSKMTHLLQPRAH